MKKSIIYIHGKGGSSAEAERCKSLFPEWNVTGLDYGAQTPWEAKEEFPGLFDAAVGGSDTVAVIANSIGAFFAMYGLESRKISRAFFISPVVNMEKLICDMLTWAGVTEAELQLRKEICTSFGEVLSWDYLCYVRSHPLQWTVPTAILYGGRDNLTSYATVSDFAEKHGFPLTVMQDGEHWFHTAGQLEFLDEWLMRSTT